MKWAYLLGYLAMPAVLLIHFWIGLDAKGPKHWEPTVTFILSGMAIIPLAGLMGRSTEQLAVRTGSLWGGLLNATFGNASELIIGVVALSKGLNSIAKASLAGSIIGNLLLVAGMSMLVGGWRRESQSFSRKGAEANAGLLAVAVSGMLLPAIFHFSFSGRDPHLVQHELGISVGTAVVLLAVYALGLVFTLKTHRHIFSPPPATSDEDPAGLHGVDGGWTVRRCILGLALASAGIAVFSEFLVGSVHQAAEALHWNYTFVGVIVVAIVGNAAEHSTAILLAHRNDMDTAMTISVQSSLQIALFVTPFLILVSLLFASFGMKLPGPAEPRLDLPRLDLVFEPLEVVGVLISVGIVVTISRNGESNWFEGALLLAVYAILAITFFFIPRSAAIHPTHDLPERSQRFPAHEQ